MEAAMCNSVTVHSIGLHPLRPILDEWVGLRAPSFPTFPTVTQVAVTVRGTP